MQPNPSFMNPDDFPEPHMEPVKVSEAERLAREIDGARYGDVAAELRRLADLEGAYVQQGRDLTVMCDECDRLAAARDRLVNLNRTLRAALDEAPQGESVARVQWLRELLSSVMDFRPGDDGMVRGGPYVRADSLLQAAEVAADRPSAPTMALTDSATVELAWLEGWLQFADECVGVECCGHGVGGECCGNPGPVTRKPAEVIEAMAQRHRVLTAMLGEKSKEGGA